MRVLITGGTGLIGRALVPRLVKSNYAIQLVTRNKDRARLIFSNYNIEFIETNILQDKNWLRLINKPDIIINLIGERVISKRWTSKQKRKIIDSRVIPSEIIAEYVRENPDIFVVTASGTDYYPYNENNNIVYSEISPPGTMFLSKVCTLWEKSFLNLLDNVCIFRIAGVLTPNWHGIEKMFIAHRYFLGGIIGNGKQIINWVHIDDVVGAIIYSIEHKLTGIYNLVGSEQASMAKIMGLVGKIMRKPVWIRIPGFALKIFMGERADILLKGRSVSNKKLIDAGYKFRYEKIEDALRNIII